MRRRLWKLYFGYWWLQCKQCIPRCYLHLWWYFLFFASLQLHQRLIHFNRRYGNSLNLYIWFMPSANRKRVSWCLVVLPRISQYSGCKKSLKSITRRTLLNVIALAPTPSILITTMVSLDHPDPYDTEKAELWSGLNGGGSGPWFGFTGGTRTPRGPIRHSLSTGTHAWVCVLNEV